MDALVTAVLAKGAPDNQRHNVFHLFTLISHKKLVEDAGNGGAIQATRETRMQKIDLPAKTAQHLLWHSAKGEVFFSHQPNAGSRVPQVPSAGTRAAKKNTTVFPNSGTYYCLLLISVLSS